MKVFLFFLYVPYERRYYDAKSEIFDFINIVDQRKNVQLYRLARDLFLIAALSKLAHTM